MVPGVTEDNFKRLFRGTAVADVEAIMGCPPIVSWSGTSGNRYSYTWTGEKGSVVITNRDPEQFGELVGYDTAFGGDGGRNVIWRPHDSPYLSFAPTPTTSRIYLDKIRRWLGL